jgi:signal transduction histidine kinase
MDTRREPEGTPAPHPQAPPGHHRGRVLVVDDKEVVRDFLREVLELAGYEVETVADGAAALEVCRHRPPQVVLTDLAMQPMSGRDLIVALKRICPSAVPVVLTGYGTVERAVDLMRLGAFDVLTKPCRAEEITATVEKALEHHLALQSNEELRERLRVQDKLAMIGKLAAGVAHELNNPLDAALRCVRLTRDHVNGDAEAREYLTMAESGMQRMADIVQSLLTFSRNAAVEQAPQGLEELIADAIASVSLVLDRPATSFRSDVGASVAHVSVPRGMHQVVTNLLRNACDAVGPRAEVVVSARRDEESLVIEVADRGPGIPADILPRVFEPFFTTKPPGRGTGLGLPISARLVEKFGGQIRVECPASGGTVVIVVLPLPRFVAPPVSEVR